MWIDVFGGTILVDAVERRDDGEAVERGAAGPRRGRGGPPWEVCPLTDRARPDGSIHREGFSIEPGAVVGTTVDEEAGGEAAAATPRFCGGGACLTHSVGFSATSATMVMGFASEVPPPPFR